MPIIHIRDERPSGTPGDLLTANVFNAIPLNTVRTNTIPGAALDATVGQVELPGGTYSFEGQTSMGHLGQAALYNATKGEYIIRGVNSPLTGAPSGPYHFVRGAFTLDSPALLELHVRTAAPLQPQPTSYGDPEVYAELLIRAE
jgi:hypothetical protein